MNIEYKIMVEVFHWKEVLKVKHFLLGIDNRTKYLGYVCNFGGVPVLFLNFKKMKKEAPLENISTIFHELGHIKHHTYDWKPTKSNKIRCEYLAETFALKQMKKYYPTAVKQYIKGWQEILQDEDWCKKFPCHAKAFSRISEYKEEK